jgi:hypothetical protein
MVGESEEGGSLLQLHNTFELVYRKSVCDCMRIVQIRAGFFVRVRSMMARLVLALCLPFQTKP